MRLVGFAVVALCCAACGPSATGSIALVTTGGAEVAGERVDFGDVIVGQTSQQNVTARNTGSVPLDLSVTYDSGDGPPLFLVTLARLTLGPGQSATFPVSFAPTAPGSHEAVFIVRAGSASPARLTLRGNGVLGGCTVGGLLDFGAVEIGATLQLGLTFTNPTSIATTADVGPVSSSSGEAFAFEKDAASATGQLTVPAGGSAHAFITFSPKNEGADLALMRVRPLAWCDPVNVVLSGEGISNALSCAPSPLDLGFQSPGGVSQRTLTISNASSAPILLTHLFTSFPSFATPLQSITVPAKGSASVPVTFQPTSEGPFAATLTATTDDLARNLNCPLLGHGGAPDIDLSPLVLDLGDVPFFGVTQPFFVSSHVTVRNVGLHTTAQDSIANLHVTSIDVVPSNADSAASEICAGVFSNGTCTMKLPPPYDDFFGLAGGDAIDLPIRVQPVDVGKSMEWQVRLHTNDPDEPSVTVTVRAHSVQLPPCNASISPASLSFGLVSPPSFRELAVQIQNLGSGSNDTCLVTNVDLAAGTDPTFRIVGGPMTSFVLQPGEVKVIAVRAGETSGAASATGAIVIGLSDPSSPQRTVPLTAFVGTGCLVSTPSSLDFGTVRQSCNSETKQATLVNTCTFAVDINGCDTTPPSGFTGGCTSKTLSTGGALNVPVTFNAVMSGLSLGSLVVHVQGQGADVVVPLRGYADQAGANTDSFTIARPKVDVLLVVDDSGSMMDKRSDLLSSSPAFLTEALSTGVDFHLGVTTGNTNGPHLGELLGSGAEPRVLTPSTPALATLFSSRIAPPLVGGDEEFAAPALRALTVPLLSTVNAGFLRPDAWLAVIVITDMGDVSPDPALTYVNRLRAVKPDGHVTYSAMEPIANPSPVGCNTLPMFGLDEQNEIVDAFGGLKEDICTKSWPAALAELGHLAFLPDNGSLTLRNSPDLTAGNVLTVSVNGQPIDATTPGNVVVWSYDPLTNSVRFAAAYQPQPGSAVTVSYLVPCF